ncbi:kinase-like domain-containing protein [Rhizophagus clarus]|uniref:Kinase-like domain-containing protein n=1 Tax=Rhizophagus clarus TaxID=94130 RepID=A0A8H3LKQ2_9GLOM|nr:kinase-like domain-containing protein [Rhizophagus clarus]
MSKTTIHIKVTGNSNNEHVNWIEEAIAKNYIKYYEYNSFNNIEEIGCGSFGKVYRAKWKNCHRYLALKSFFDFNVTIKEVVNELKLQREVDFHDNIIRFFGITTENQNDNPKKYWLVMEYADSGTLQEYLSNNFDNLTWNNKLNMALQLARAVSCLHDEGIVHRDLHPKNILVHQKIIKLADFGLSKRIAGDACKSRSDCLGIVPYVDPKKFDSQKYSLNKKSDVYSVGVLLWEISSGRPPFKGISFYCLILRISQGIRETPILDTPTAYVNLYTECWNGEQDNRPTINQVVDKLEELKCNRANNNFNTTIDEIVDLSNNVEDIVIKKVILDYLNNHNMTLQEFYDWLSKNQNNPNYINLNGIGTDTDRKKAFELYQKSADLGNPSGLNNLGCCYKIGIGVDIDKKKAFELHQKAADLGNAFGVTCLGHCYEWGIGTDTNEKKAFELYHKATELGNITAINSLGHCYRNGTGTDVDEKKAFKLYQLATDFGNPSGINNLGYCYKRGIGVDINKKNAFELYQKAADLGDPFGIYSLGVCYEKGIGANIDKRKSFELYQKAAELGNVFGINSLGYCYEHGVETDINKEKAFELYQKAASLGHADGVKNLVHCYQKGIGTDIDEEKALELYQKAVNK